MTIQEINILIKMVIGKIWDVYNSFPETIQLLIVLIGIFKTVYEYVSGVKSISSWFNDKRKSISGSRQRKKTFTDTLIIIINILLGFLLPFIFVFADLNALPSWLEVVIITLSWLLIVSNLGLWLFIGYTAYLLSKVNFEKLLGKDKTSRAKNMPAPHDPPSISS